MRRISYQLVVAGYFDASDYLRTDYMRGYVAAALSDALEAERAKVAAAYEAAASVQVEGMDYCSPSTKAAIRALTPADAQAALDKMLAEARLEGWRAGRDAAAQVAENKCTKRSQYSLAQSCKDAIRALPEPKEASHD